MEWLQYVIDYGVITVLVIMSIIALAVAAERRMFFRKLQIAAYTDKKTLELHLTRRLHIIATVGSNAPYVGLLGTVLGIMLTFSKMGSQGIAETGQIMFGLALALKATAVGIAVAIPAVVMYNFLLRSARELILKWEIGDGR
ncbi:MAG TPA: TonB-system energizer ExbB [Syntrophorhabdaceae bacterium]|nr:TonB-system energizer ExbB [Syntrophorhabdaceae bacterium]